MSVKERLADNLFFILCAFIALVTLPCFIIRMLKDDDKLNRMGD